VNRRADAFSRPLAAFTVRKLPERILGPAVATGIIVPGCWTPAKGFGWG
jgi:hypothetical protein